MMIDAGPQKSALSDPYDVGWILLDDSGYTTDEAYAFLTADVSEVFSRQAVLTASANPAAHTGAMIALVPSREDLARLALKGGEPLEDLHLTLAYLGEASAIDEDTRSRIINAAGGHFTDVVNTEAFSVNVFNPHNPDMETAVVLGVKGEEMADSHSSLMSAVRGVFGGMPDNHKPWIPHITLKYTDDVTKEDQEEFLSRLGAVKFDTLRFAFADENIDIPLYDEDEEPLISAFKWRETDHPRNAEGKFVSSGDVDVSAFAARVRDAQTGRSARNSAGSVKSLSKSDAKRRQAASTYETNSFDINRKLREGGFDASTVSERQPLEDMMSESPLSADVVVTRGIRRPEQIFGSAWQTDGDNTGLRWRDPAFVSTTTSDSVSKFFSENNTDKDEPVVMRILAPKGTGALKMDLGIAFGQKEVLLDRNLVFQIVKDNGRDKNGVRQVDVEVVPAP